MKQKYNLSDVTIVAPWWPGTGCVTFDSDANAIQGITNYYIGLMFKLNFCNHKSPLQGPWDIQQIFKMSGWLCHEY